MMWEEWEEWGKESESRGEVRGGHEEEGSSQREHTQEHYGHSIINMYIQQFV